MLLSSLTTQTASSSNINKAGITVRWVVHNGTWISRATVALQHFHQPHQCRCIASDSSSSVPHSEGRHVAQSASSLLPEASASQQHAASSVDTAPALSTASDHGHGWPQKAGAAEAPGAQPQPAFPAPHVTAQAAPPEAGCADKPVAVKSASKPLSAGSVKRINRILQASSVEDLEQGSSSAPHAGTSMHDTVSSSAGLRHITHANKELRTRMQCKRMALQGVRARRVKRLDAELALGRITEAQHQEGVRLAQEDLEQRMALVDQEEEAALNGQAAGVGIVHRKPRTRPPQDTLQFKRLAPYGLRTRRVKRLDAELAAGSITEAQHQEGVRLAQEEFEQKMALVEQEAASLAQAAGAALEPEDQVPSTRTPEEALKYKRLAVYGVRTRRVKRLDTELALGSITEAQHQEGVRLAEAVFERRMAVLAAVPRRRRRREAATKVKDTKEPRLPKVQVSSLGVDEQKRRLPFRRMSAHSVRNNKCRRLTTQLQKGLISEEQHSKGLRLAQEEFDRKMALLDKEEATLAGKMTLLDKEGATLGAQERESAKPKYTTFMKKVRESAKPKSGPRYQKVDPILKQFQLRRLAIAGTLTVKTRSYAKKLAVGSITSAEHDALLRQAQEEAEQKLALVKAEEQAMDAAGLLPKAPADSGARPTPWAKQKVALRAAERERLKSIVDAAEAARAAGTLTAEAEEEAKQAAEKLRRSLLGVYAMSVRKQKASTSSSGSNEAGTSSSTTTTGSASSAAVPGEFEASSSQPASPASSSAASGTPRTRARARASTTSSSSPKPTQLPKEPYGGTSGRKWVQQQSAQRAAERERLKSIVDAAEAARAAGTLTAEEEEEASKAAAKLRRCLQALRNRLGCKVQDSTSGSTANSAAGSGSGGDARSSYDSSSPTATIINSRSSSHSTTTTTATISNAVVPDGFGAISSWLRPSSKKSSRTGKSSARSSTEGGDAPKAPRTRAKTTPSSTPGSSTKRTTKRKAAAVTTMATTSPSQEAGTAPREAPAGTEVAVQPKNPELMVPSTRARHVTKSTSPALPGQTLPPSRGRPKGSGKAKKVLAAASAPEKEAAPQDVASVVAVGAAATRASRRKTAVAASSTAPSVSTQKKAQKKASGSMSRAAPLPPPQAAAAAPSAAGPFSLSQKLRLMQRLVAETAQAVVTLTAQWPAFEHQPREVFEAYAREVEQSKAVLLQAQGMLEALRREMDPEQADVDAWLYDDLQAPEPASSSDEDGEGGPRRQQHGLAQQLADEDLVLHALHVV